MSKSVSPILSKLMNRVLTMKPTDVLSFLIAELESLRALEAPSTGAVHVAAHDIAREIRIVLLGIDCSGKTSLLNCIQGRTRSDPRPTQGFKPVSMTLNETTTVKFYDLGGGEKIRDIWPQYFHDVHCVLYALDGSETEERWDESITTCLSTLSNSHLISKPLLIMCTKQDQEHARSVEQVAKQLGIHSMDRTVHICGCTTRSENQDPRIEASVQWLLGVTNAMWHTLDQRVRTDMEHKAEEVETKRQERDRRVLKEKISQTFLTNNATDIFSAQTGLEFLAAEVGTDVELLAPLGDQAAAMVGYQKLALQMLGAMVAPVGRGRVPVSWQAVVQLVADLRGELGLPQTLGPEILALDTQDIR
jgi:ADP-ribosylation factor-like protein 13B